MENTEERFRAIYDRYMPLLRLIASRKSIPYDEIDDLVQETFTSFIPIIRSHGRNTRYGRRLPGSYAISVPTISEDKAPILSSM